MHAYAQDALFVSARKLKLFAQQHSAPFYLYDEAGIRRTATQLQGAFGRFAGFRQYFPVALNPNPALLQLLCQLGYGAVCENAAQLQLAEHAGFSGTALLYAPLLIMPDAEALAHQLDCTFVLDGPHCLPQRAPKRVLLTLRPEGRLRLADGSSIQFDTLKTGMPEAELFHLAQRLHLAGTQSFGLILPACHNDLRPGYYPAIAQTLCTAAVRLKAQTGITAECCNLADGFGISYRHGEPEPELPACCDAIAQIVQETLIPAGLTATRLETTLGRFVLAKHAIFVARVAAVKTRKTPLLILEAAAQQFPDASPLATYHHVSILGSSEPQRWLLYDISGCQFDLRRLMAARRLLPPAQPGDWLVFHDAGVNGSALAAPAVGYPPCAEFLFTQSGEFQHI